MVTRRQFLQWGGLAVLGAVGTTTTYLHLNDESEELVVVDVQLPITGLNPSLEGLTIVQLSDIHLLPFTKPAFVQRAVDTANALQPDVTVLTGDYVWHEVEAMFELAPIIGGLNARYGVYSVLGNHDIWTDLEVIKQGMRDARLPLLINQGIPITVGSGTLHLAGLDDGWSGAPDLAATMANAPDDATTILLLHEPDLADKYAQDGRIAVQLAGHSHGGQVRWPRTGALLLPYLGRKYDFQLYKVQDMWLYTNPGIGVTSTPFRYNCPPEITRFTLTAV
jgi:predicted MPP superfamily phosphohydrolase